MKRLKSPCTVECPDRARLLEEFGGCHNEHCPRGWAEYERQRNENYRERLSWKGKYAKKIERDMQNRRGDR